jgi:RNA polymerase sigma-70 factor (ECF subfamily)
LTSKRDQSPSDDVQLVHRCRQGEPEAFARLVEIHQTNLFVRIYRWIGQKEAAEEITQDVFLKAYRDLKNFRGDAKFSTWLFQIALNRCRDFWRAQKRSPAGWVPLEEARGAAEPGDPADLEAERNQKARNLRRALAELPEIYRETLALRFLNDLSCQEIAEATGQGISNVKMRLLRGLEKLRKKLI